MMRKFKESIKQSVDKGLSEIVENMYDKTKDDTVSFKYEKDNSTIINKMIHSFKYHDPTEKICDSIILQKNTQESMTVHRIFNKFINSDEFKDYMVDAVIAKAGPFILTPDYRSLPVNSAPSLNILVPDYRSLPVNSAPSLDVTVYVSDFPINGKNKDGKTVISVDICTIEKIVVDKLPTKTAVSYSTVIYTINDIYIADKIINFNNDIITILNKKWNISNIVTDLLKEYEVKNGIPDGISSPYLDNEIVNTITYGVERMLLHIITESVVDKHSPFDFPYLKDYEENECLIYNEDKDMSVQILYSIKFADNMRTNFAISIDRIDMIDVSDPVNELIPTTFSFILKKSSVSIQVPYMYIIFDYINESYGFDKNEKLTEEEFYERYFLLFNFTNTNNKRCPVIHKWNYKFINYHYYRYMESINKE